MPQWLAFAELLLTGVDAIRKQVTAKQGFLPATDGAAWAPLKRDMKSLLESFAEREDVAQALAALRQLPPPALTDGQWERIDALSAVLPHAVAQLLALFGERDSLDHPAVAAAARDALGDESAPTELALSLDYRIHHLLVDEYQDTSPSQERLLRLLVAGWQPGDGRSLFCVGDPMQSIYAFREADVTLFLQAQRRGIGAVPLVAERLGRNFRSSIRHRRMGERDIRGAHAGGGRFRARRGALFTGGRGEGGRGRGWRPCARAHRGRCARDGGGSRGHRSTGARCGW